MPEVKPVEGEEQPAWRQRAVSRSLHAARSRAEVRVQRFLDAAFELIDEKGSTDFTIQEVIDRSKQSLRGFYQYFDGKDELLLALFEETVSEAIDDLHAVDGTGGRADRPAARVRDLPPRVVRSGRHAAQAGHAQPAPDLGVLGAARRQLSRSRQGRAGAHLAAARRAARRRARGRATSKWPTGGAPPRS